MVLKFRMLSDENDNFVRDFEVDPTMTLAEFHNFIIASLGYDDCMASFFTADDKWNRQREFTLMDMGEGMGFDEEDMPIPMSKVTLAEIVIAEYTRLIYLFDMFANRAYYIELVSSAQPNPQLDYPRVAFENAPVPDQYDPDAVDSTSGSIFDEMMDDFSEFGGDDSYDDEY
ncbi:MAG: hypothetical protein IKA70_07140 [Alistipes sp.]|nr:hypothetical protein [Alistipes sp.]MBR2975394.1 hypothetical protein [Alistipes sp.]